MDLPVNNAFLYFTKPFSAHTAKYFIDGGNWYYVDNIRRGMAVAAKCSHYLDVRTSGGGGGWSMATAR
jgi:6-phosphogluconate dehydrogenase (decarboxylating)